MPLYRYSCSGCSSITEHLHAHDETVGACECGGELERRLSVAAIVVCGARAAPPAPATGPLNSLMRSADTAAPSRDTGPAIPAATYTKPWERCSAAERTERYTDTREAMTQWQADSIAADGVPYAEAKSRAREHQTKVIEHAVREDSTTA